MTREERLVHAKDLRNLASDLRIESIEGRMIKQGHGGGEIRHYGEYAAIQHAAALNEIAAALLTPLMLDDIVVRGLPGNPDRSTIGEK